MSQAEIDPIKTFEAAKASLPSNPLADTQTRETLVKCSQVCAFLSDAIPSIEHAGMPIGEHGANGISWILQGVREALDHAAEQEVRDDG